MQKVVRTFPEGKYKCPEDELECYPANSTYLNFSFPIK